jgi:hypothetical protein
MTRDQVLELLGPPQRQEMHGLTEFLIYSTDGKSATALLDFMPIAIVDGRVTGTGRSLYEAVVQAHSTRVRGQQSRGHADDGKGDLEQASGLCSIPVLGYESTEEYEPACCGLQSHAGFE